MSVSMENLLKFINEHLDDDTSRLLLSRAKWPDIDVDTAVFTIDARRRLRSKLPRWASCDSLIVPTRLASEQCSSSATAAYKASLAARVTASASPTIIADLTSGLGADVLAFSEVAEKVVYNDMNPALVNAARHNLPALGADNVEFRCCEIVSSASLPVAQVTSSITSEAGSAGQRSLNRGTIAQMLDDIVPDLIFADPARRDTAGGKVFLIEDCRPDIIGLRSDIFRICRHLLVKLSPMADIAMACERLGPCCREVHVVGADGECKELLIWMDREFSGEYSIVVAELGKGTVRFTPSQERAASPIFASADDFSAGSILFEPGKALMKAGAFNLLCERFGLRKADVSSHLYTCSDDADIAEMGKRFRIVEVAEFNNRNIKEIAKKYPRAELTARNLPISTDQLRKKMGLKSGDLHIFAMKTRSLGNIILVTERC